MNFLKNYLIWICIMLFCIKSIDANTKDDKFAIKDMKQRVTFELDKKDNLVAIYEVGMTIKLTSTVSTNFNKSIFFDDNSSIGYISLKDKSGKRKINPSISDYESNGIFHSDLKVCNFNVPLTKEGEEVKIMYSKEIQDYKFLDPLYFNDYYDVENSTVEIKVPVWLDLDMREFNFNNNEISKEEEQLEKEKIYTFNSKDIPASFRAKGEPRRSKYSPHLILIPQSMKTKKSGDIRLMKDVTDLYGWYRSLVKEIGNENEGLKSKVTDLVAGKTTDEEKIKSIFYWVQDNIKYIAFEEGIMGFKPENCQSVYNNKYGDCKGMANLTKEMLQLAGYDARLTWIGTSDLPYSYDMPSLVVDNHMICSMMLDGKRIYLDATEKYADLYNYAHRIRGKQVLIEDGDKYLIETVPVQKPEDSKQLVENSFTINGAKLVGTGKVTYTGNKKTSVLYNLSANTQTDREDQLRNYLANYDKNMKLQLATEITLEDRDDDLIYAYQLEVENQIIDIGNELYVNLELEYPFQNFKMDEDRFVPYDFRSTFLVADKITLEIPSNYSVQYIPEKVSVDTKGYAFELSIEKSGNTLLYEKKITIKNSLLEVSDFKNWNELMEELNTFYADQIILEKQ